MHEDDKRKHRRKTSVKKKIIVLRERKVAIIRRDSEQEVKERERKVNLEGKRRQNQCKRKS